MTSHATIPLGEPASRLDTSRVLETLDSEMARLEQAVIRSGWTMWAGVGVLGALGWGFLSLMDFEYRFPWERFIVYVVSLSCVVEFWNSVKQRLIPKAEFALNHGGQYRVLVTKETLPFERVLHTFLAARSVLLLMGCFYLYVVVGDGAFIPALMYGCLFLVMCRYLWLNFKERLTSRRRKPSSLYMIGSLASAAVAVWSLIALGLEWGIDDQSALKGAAIAVSALFVLEWMAAPRLELPILERIREIRRQLGFHQISAEEAVERCEIALFGHPSAKFLESSLKELRGEQIALAEAVQQIPEHVTDLDRHLKEIEGQQPPPSTLFRQAASVVEQAYTIGLNVQLRVKRFVTRRTAFEKSIKELQEKTQNDESLGLTERQAAEIFTDVRALIESYADCLRKIRVGTQTLTTAASANNVRLAEHVYTRVEELETMLARVGANGDLAV